MKTWIKTHQRDLIILSLILAMSSLIRFWFIFNVGTIQLYDFDTYYQLAVNVASGQGYTLGGYPVAWQGMLYSTVLGMVFKILGTTSMAVPKILNIVMSELSIIFIYALMKKIYNKPIALWTAVIVMAFMPRQIAYVNVIGTEILTSFLLSGTILFSLLDLKFKIKYPILGVLIGLMTLTKPIFIAYPVLLGVYHWLTTKSWREALMQFAIMFFTMWLVVMPWTIRNYQKFDRFIPVSYNSGYILYINNNDENVHGGWMDHTTISAPESLIEAMAAEVEDHGASIKTSPNLELLMKPYAVDWISSHPIEFLKLGVLRIDATYFSGSWDITANAMNDFKFDPETSSVDAFSFQRNINLLVAVSDIFMALISSFGAVFVFINIWRILKNLFNKRVRLESFMVVPVLNLAFFSLIYFIYEGQPRYNFVTLFLLTMCFAMGLEIIVSHMGKSAEIGVTKDAE